MHSFGYHMLSNMVILERPRSGMGRVQCIKRRVWKETFIMYWYYDWNQERIAVKYQVFGSLYLLLFSFWWWNHLWIPEQFHSASFSTPFLNLVWELVNLWYQVWHRESIGFWVLVLSYKAMTTYQKKHKKIRPETCGHLTWNNDRQGMWNEGGLQKKDLLASRNMWSLCVNWAADL